MNQNEDRIEQESIAQAEAPRQQGDYPILDSPEIKESSVASKAVSVIDFHAPGTQSEKIDAYYLKDKVTKTVFSGKEIATSKQVPIRVASHTEAKDTKVVVFVALVVARDGMTSVTFTAQQLEVLNAIVTLYNIGVKAFTDRQVGKLMLGGGSRNAGAKKLQFIRDTISLMSVTKIYIDNKAEAERYNYPVHNVNEAYLLPVEAVHTIIGEDGEEHQFSFNGKVTNSAYTFLKKPALLSYAEEHRQLTSVPLALNAAPINDGEAAAEIKLYLVDRISSAKGKPAYKRTAQDRTIRFDTVREHMTTPSAKPSRDVEKVLMFLDHCVKIEYIKRYTKKGNDSVTIYFDDDSPAIAKR